MGRQTAPVQHCILVLKESDSAMMAESLTELNSGAVRQTLAGTVSLLNICRSPLGLIDD